MNRSSSILDAAPPFRECARQVQALHLALKELEQVAQKANVSPLEEREWYQLLVGKLLPQLTDDAYLVVAVVGGTNIGKSVIFNHLAGCRASATSPLASGTKHPTLLVRGEFADSHDLSQIFPGFHLHAWTNAEEALEEDSQHRLYWRVNASTAENLLVLDTPDIDSDARVNWDRADRIRRSADVLIAVLTQQKYNDAAVKEFFRKAAQEDKAVIIVFNQCQLPEDEAYWPLWVNTFCQETGVRPELIYIAPNDRTRAEANQLPFYERSWPVDIPEQAEPAEVDVPEELQEPRDLLQDLSRLKFGDVKFRTLRGSLRELQHPSRGIPGYLTEIRQRSEEFRSAAELLTAHQLAEIDNWPTIPNSMMVAEVRRWWATQREGWSARVHGFYNIVGRGITWPFRVAKEKFSSESVTPLEQYRQREWLAILEAVEKVLGKLTWLSELGNDHLKPRLKAILSGTNRLALLETIQRAHESFDLQTELTQLVDRQLADFRSESPRYYELFRRLDTIAAAARPATSVVLFMTGFGPVGEVLVPAFTDTALQGAIHVAGDIAGGTVAAAVGESVISEGASSGAGYLEAKFHKLHAAFTASRAAWLGGLLKEHVLGRLPEDMAEAAGIPDSESFAKVEALRKDLQGLVEQSAPARKN